MIYTPEEKQKIEELIEIFQDYLQHMEDYEILYSNKVGYLWLVTADNADYIYFPVESRDEFLSSLVSSVIFDNQTPDETFVDYDAVHHFFLTQLEKLGADFNHCMKIVNDCLVRHRNFRKTFFEEDIFP